jgi:hypothetical protein
VVALEPLRTVHLALSAPSDERTRFDVEVRFLGGGILERFESQKAPVNLTTVCPDSIDAVEVGILATTSTSTETARLERLVPLMDKGDTHVAIDPEELRPAGATAVLDVTVAAAAEVDSIRSWQLSLVPVRTEGADPSSGNVITSNLSQWDCLSPRRSFAQQFDDLQAGVYDLVIRPIGYTRRVELVSGQHLTERIHVPALAELQVWPVDSEGHQVPDVASLGVHLYWYWADTGVTPGEEESGRVVSNLFAEEDGSLGAGILSGAVLFAPMTASGSWLLTAPAGREVRIEVLGSKVLGAKPLTVELVPGPMDATITFAGL